MTLRDKRVTGAYGDMRFKQGVANIVLKHKNKRVLLLKVFLPEFVIQ